MLVLAPTDKDAELTRSVLGRAGVETRSVHDVEEACRLLTEGAGALLLPEEALARGGSDRLAESLAEQPAWSDLPVLVMTRSGEPSAEVARELDRLGNVTVLERPMRVATLISAVRSALRGRDRQYEIREHLAERVRTEAALRANDSRKDEFLAVLAHELRNPLAPIRNSIHILRMTGPNAVATERVTEIIERQVNHMVRLVDDLLEISRITRGKIELRKQPVEIGAIVASAVETSRPWIEAAGHRLDVSVPTEPVWIEADPVRLGQVLANLLNNAAKYTDPRGRIWLTATREGDRVVLSVRDTGAGIPPEMLPRVFDMFVQIAPASDRAQGGLGIGLTLVKSLVEMHEGEVEARSEGLGRGSEFVVRLPSRDSTHPENAAPRREAVGPLAPMRVLVVDDNQDAADTLVVLLSLLGAIAHVAHSGPEALAALETFRPSVVLLDIGMPGMDGYEVAHRIRQEPEYGDVTIIALTGWGQEETRRRTRLAGFDHHLVKPADFDELKALLGSLQPRESA